MMIAWHALAPGRRPTISHFGDPGRRWLDRRISGGSSANPDAAESRLSMLVACLVACPSPSSRPARTSPAPRWRSGTVTGRSGARKVRGSGWPASPHAKSTRAAGAVIPVRRPAVVPRATISSPCWAAPVARDRPAMSSCAGRVSRACRTASAKGDRTGALCRAPEIGDLSCAMVRSGYALRWRRYGGDSLCGSERPQD